MGWLLALHLLIVVMVFRNLPPRSGIKRVSGWVHWVMLGSIAVFMPLLGSGLLWLFSHRYLVPANTGQKQDPVSPTGQAQEDFLHYFDSPEREVELRYEQGDERLNALNIDNYLDLLMSSRELGGKSAVALLKQALGCKAENARLLAYALYSKKEQGLFQLLDGMLVQLKQGQMKNPRLNLAIAQLYWHMLDIDLIDSAVAQDVWDKLYLHAQLAAKYSPSLWQPYWLLAQADLQARRYLQAKQHFLKALVAGAGKARIEPFLFEIQFCLRRDLSLT